MSAATPYRQSGWVNNRIIGPLLVALGRTPSLTVRGRTSGRVYRMPVLPLDYEGKRYLVAPRGNTHWARNLRATGEGELRESGRRTRFKAREIPVEQRGPLVAAYVQRYGKKYGGFVAKEFEAMPNPADHPVFLVETEPTES